jgi:hypothetical protein
VLMHPARKNKNKLTEKNEKKDKSREKGKVQCQEHLRKNKFF